MEDTIQYKDHERKKERTEIDLEKGDKSEPSGESEEPMPESFWHRVERTLSQSPPEHGLWAQVVRDLHRGLRMLECEVDAQEMEAWVQGKEGVLGQVGGRMQSAPLLARRREEARRFEEYQGDSLGDGLALLWGWLQSGLKECKPTMRGPMPSEKEEREEDAWLCDTLAVMPRGQVQEWMRKAQKKKNAWWLVSGVVREGVLLHAVGGTVEARLPYYDGELEGYGREVEGMVNYVSGLVCLRRCLEFLWCDTADQEAEALEFCQGLCRQIDFSERGGWEAKVEEAVRGTFPSMDCRFVLKYMEQEAAHEGKVKRMVTLKMQEVLRLSMVDEARVRSSMGSFMLFLPEDMQQTAREVARGMEGLVRAATALHGERYHAMIWKGLSLLGQEPPFWE